MRKSFLLLAGAGAVLLAACSGDKKTAMDDDLNTPRAVALIHEAVRDERAEEYRELRGREQHQ